MDAIKRCFVICPIGPEKSDIRQDANDLFDLIIEPALEIYGFTVIRADKIVGPGQINIEVIELVQNAELCIVDLTGHNPNVFYECGRRHETAKPFIQLIRTGQELPFDLAGVRTLQYDLSSPRSTHDAIQEIRRQVQSLEESGYASSTSGVSTVTLAQAIDRIERKIDRLAGSGPAVGMPVQGGRPGLGLQDVMRNPDDSFLSAIATGDIDRAVAAFQYIRRISNDPQRIIAFAGLLAMQGRPEAASALRDLLNSDRAADLADEEYRAAVSALGRFYARTDTEPDGISEMKAFIEPKLSSDIATENKAYYHNQLQMMYFGARRYGEALEQGLAAIGLNPANVAYKYNVSLIYEALDRVEEAERYVDEYMADGGDDDADHLGQAIDIYLKRNRPDDVRSTFARLAEVDPGKAALKSMIDDDLRAIVGV